MPKQVIRSKQAKKAKSSGKGRVPRNLAARELDITRMVETTVSLTSGTAAGYGLNGTNANNITFSFALSQLNIYIGGTSNQVNLPNYTEFTTLFDQYCIKKVEMLAFYNLNTATNTGGATTVSSLPVFAIVDDYTDSGVLTDMNSALQYGNCKLIQFGNIRSNNDPAIRHSIVPRPGIDANAYGVATSALVPKGLTWLDTQAATVPHYSMKMYYDNWSTAANASQGEIQFFFKYTFRFRQPK